jgi:hypothetical protein
VVLKGIDGPINETQQNDLSTVFTAGQRMLSLISYLVEIARLNNGHTQLSRENADIAELITETTSRWKTQNQTKPLTVETNLTNPIFNVDKAQMRQIISHLLSFASVRVTEGLFVKHDDLFRLLALQVLLHRLAASAAALISSSLASAGHGSGGRAPCR